MNVKLLRQISAHILEEPNRFMMGDVIHKGAPGDKYFGFGLSIEVPKCGTVACIAGWALRLSDINSESMTRAGKLLGLTQSQGDRLFLLNLWPVKFREEWEASKTPAIRTKIAAERIEHLIDTAGAE